MDGFWPTFQRRSPAPPPVSPETACLPALRPDLPEKVLLPLQDAPATAYEALVQKDDQVTAGQKIGTMGTAPDNIGVHASVSGLVTDIALHPHPLGTPVMTITITTGEQEHTATCHFENTGKDGAAAFWRDMGIPLDFHSIRTCTTLLVNMTEIEPGLSAK
ncbi:MAG: hypothetical protein GY868_16635, partial [Deltaproteobacteria bacterium]|nr:hypothetical protein [Deltaproteobacteria bacterium]